MILCILKYSYNKTIIKYQLATFPAIFLSKSYTNFILKGIKETLGDQK